MSIKELFEIKTKNVFNQHIGDYLNRKNSKNKVKPKDAPTNQHSHLADLLDDLDHKKLTELLNYIALSVKDDVDVRAIIAKWRELKKLPA